MVDNLPGSMTFTGKPARPGPHSRAPPVSRSHVLCAVLSRVQPFVTPWTAARQAPLSMGFSRQEYWGGLPCPPGDILNPGIKPRSSTLQADSLLSEPPGKPI